MAEYTIDKIEYGNDVYNLESKNLKNLVDGSTVGSVRTIYATEEDNSYTMGQYAIAEGIATQASAISAHAEGLSTVAEGDYSHAEGNHTIASGDCSHVQNEGTSATMASQTVIGTYNVNDRQPATAVHPNGQTMYGNYAFIIGNGTGVIGMDNIRSNALTVDWQGRVECGDYSGVFQSIFDIFYPVGSYYETSDDTFDPNVAWGGTWVKDSAGRVTVAIDTSNTALDTLGETGGKKDAIVPYHNHGFTQPTISEKAADTSGTPSNNTSGAMSANSSISGTLDFRKWSTSGHLIVANSGVFTQADVSTAANSFASNNANDGKVQRITLSKNIAHTHSLQSHTHSIPKHSHTASGGAVGYAGTNGNATNANLQPYVVVNRWHRIA